MLPELENELMIYNHLNTLQDVCIPKVVLSGHWSFFFVIGLSLCGSVPTELSRVQKRRLLNSLDQIHEKGVLHGDLKKENILVNEEGATFIIDFGFSTLSSDKRAHRKERSLFVKQLEYL